jgi:hypothetical protein
MQYAIHKKIMRNRTPQITHYIGPACDSRFRIPITDRAWFVLTEKEREYDQDHKERAGQQADPAQIMLDLSVIGVELRGARRRHERCGFTHLSSVFLGHSHLLLIPFIAYLIAKVFFMQQLLF